MCLWLLTACLAFLPSNPTPRIIVVPPLSGIPAPILLPTQAPTVAPTTTPTLVSTAVPTAAPSTSPTMAPTTNPAMVSTAVPTVTSTTAPTMAPTTNPAMVSTVVPTVAPTTNPAMVSTAVPTVAPTTAPTMAPTTNPAMVSTAVPTVAPTTAPTMAPTTNPAMVSTAVPTVAPTTAATMVPTTNPAMVSTAVPTVAPTTAPTMVPTTNPAMVSTAVPTAAPTTAATMVPTTNPAMVSTAVPTVAPTTASTMAPTTNPGMVSTSVPTLAPTTATTMAPTTNPAMVSTAVPTTSTTMAPTMASTAATTMFTTTAATMASTMPNTVTPTMPTSNTVTTTAPVPVIIITTGGELSSLILCNDPDIICIINPDEIITGSVPFDPRLATTPSTSSAYHSAVTGYSAHIPSYNDAVRFPREKRGIDLKDQIKTKHFISRMNSTKHKILKRETCRCVSRGKCSSSSSFGAESIDFRIVTPGTQCSDNQEYCCTPDFVTPIPTPIPTVPCGTLQRVRATNVNLTPGSADFGEFPWQAAIITKQNFFIAGGVLINNLNVLTVTHKVGYYLTSSNISNILVRLGDWDVIGANEQVMNQDYNVTRAFVHPNFNNVTLQYDLMILRLATPVPFTPAAGAALTINSACLPPTPNATYNGMRCMVSGWGKDMFDMQGQYQAVLKKVDVPILPPAPCQNKLRATRLGPDFVLDTKSFVCAGGESNKNSCTGDGGSGLVCQVNGQWVVVGLVTWGLGCAHPNVPGVYVNIAALLPWIQQQIAVP